MFYLAFGFATCIECNLIWEGTEWNNNKNNRDTKDKRGLATKKKKSKRKKKEQEEAPLFYDLDFGPLTAAERAKIYKKKNSDIISQCVEVCIVLTSYY